MVILGLVILQTLFSVEKDRVATNVRATATALVQITPVATANRITPLNERARNYDWTYRIFIFDRQPLFTTTPLVNITSKSQRTIIHWRMQSRTKESKQLNGDDCSLIDSKGNTYQLADSSVDYSKYRNLSSASDYFPPETPDDIGPLFDTPSAGDKYTLKIKVGNKKISGAGSM